MIDIYIVFEYNIHGVNNCVYSFNFINLMEAIMSAKMMKCKSCGNEISAKAKSCPTCGAKNGKPIFKNGGFG